MTEGSMVSSSAKGDVADSSVTLSHDALEVAVHRVVFPVPTFTDTDCVSFVPLIMLKFKLPAPPADDAADVTYRLVGSVTRSPVEDASTKAPVFFPNPIPDFTAAVRKVGVTPDPALKSSQSGFETKVQVLPGPETTKDTL